MIYAIHAVESFAPAIESASLRIASAERARRNGFKRQLITCKERVQNPNWSLVVALHT
jgi:hypothetical protein